MIRTLETCLCEVKGTVYEEMGIDGEVMNGEMVSVIGDEVKGNDDD